MMKASDGAKVIQLVPVAPQTVRYGDSRYSVSLHGAEEFTTARADVLFLAVMDDGSVRPVGVIGKDNYGDILGTGELCFIEDEGYPTVHTETGSSGIRCGLLTD